MLLGYAQAHGLGLVPVDVPPLHDYPGGPSCFKGPDGNVMCVSTGLVPLAPGSIFPGGDPLISGDTPPIVYVTPPSDGTGDNIPAEPLMPIVGTGGGGLIVGQKPPTVVTGAGSGSSTGGGVNTGGVSRRAAEP